MSAPTPAPVFQSSGNTPAAQALDNLIRRELRVGDPSDPRQVAQALMTRYGNTPAARSLVNEAKGLPFLQTAALAPAPVAATSATSLDLQQAKDDIEADLRELLSSNQLKDITPELEGWAQAIRAAVAEGERSAGLGIDTRQRDKTFGVRRQLGDYARAARLVGSFNARSRDEFRSLAQSLDEAAAVLLVMMGESIANTGIAGGRYLLQVPYTELQSRREAVLYALRNLNGAAQHGYGPEDFPRGLDAYRSLFKVLEEQGQGELRSLLTEAEMSRVMDELIDRAGHGVAGLRALGSTARLDLQRFQRLNAAIQWNLKNSNDSPPLLALQEALQLFVDGFGTTGGIRLINIARPPILIYGLYGNKSLSDAEERLQTLLQIRGNLATRLDCFDSCGCDERTLRQQVILDKGLYDLDRAIDLYAIGSDTSGDKAEVRAAAYGHVLRAIGERMASIYRAVPASANPQQAALPQDMQEILRLLRGAAEKLMDAAGAASATLTDAKLMLQEVTLQRQHEADLKDTVLQVMDGCGPFDSIYSEKLVDATQDALPGGDIPAVLEIARRSIPPHAYAPAPKIPLPRTLPRSVSELVSLRLAPRIRKAQDRLDKAKVELKRCEPLALAAESELHEFRIDVDKWFKANIQTQQWSKLKFRGGELEHFPAVAAHDGELSRLAKTARNQLESAHKQVEAAWQKLHEARHGRHDDDEDDC